MGKASMARKREAAFLSERELFDALTKNAFEFLDRSIDEFSTSAKFSTVHFAIAIELFLKARLMREHWSLLLEKPDQADKAAFFKGDAKTVSPDQTIERLRRIALVHISQRYQDDFSKIAKHRNKMVHFAHAGVTEASSPEDQNTIAAEQCAGWLALRTLLGEWSEFNSFKQDISRISQKMEGHRRYLQNVFEARGVELQTHREAGLRTRVCQSCNFESVKVEAALGAISETSCVVCRNQGKEISVKCCNTECGESINFTSYDGPPSVCPTCNEEMTKNEVRDYLDTGDAITKDNYFDYVPISCPECGGHHSVVKHYEIYVCVECFETGEHFEICGHCSEGQLGGVPEHSSWVGCEFCEGSAGRYKDD
jgi:hypothetical protein